MEVTIIETLETTKPIPITALAFSPSGRYLAAASQNGEITVWHTRKWEVHLKFFSLRQHFNQIQFTKDWKFYACGEISFLEVDLLKTQLTNHHQGGHLYRISPDEKICAVSQDLDSPFYLDADETFLIIEEHPIGKRYGEYKVGNIYHKLFSLQTIDIVFSPDSSTLALIIEIRDEVVQEFRLYMLPAREQVRFCSEYESNELVQPLCFSPSGQYLGYGNMEECSIELLLLGERIKIHREFYRHEDIITDLTFSHDSKLLASGSTDKTAKFWDIEQDELLYSYQHETSVTSLAFHSKNCILALGDEMGKVMILRLEL